MFEEQLKTVINELEPTIRFNNPDKCITSMSNLGKKLVLETWRNAEDPILHTINAFNDSISYATSYTFRNEYEELDHTTLESLAENHIQDYLEDLANLLIKKNKDYGSSFAKVSNELGVIPTFSVRILDKCNRLDQLNMDLQKGISPSVNESIEDTMLDLLGYYLLCIITMKFYSETRGL